MDTKWCHSKAKRASQLARSRKVGHWVLKSQNHKALIQTLRISYGFWQLLQKSLCLNGRMEDLNTLNPFWIWYWFPCIRPNLLTISWQCPNIKITTLPVSLVLCKHGSRWDLILRRSVVDHIYYRGEIGGGTTPTLNEQTVGMTDATRIQKALWLCRGLWRRIFTCHNLSWWNVRMEGFLVCTPSLLSAQ